MQGLKLKAKSVTHDHLLGVANSCLSIKEEQKTIRILDVGCGNGDLVSYLYLSFEAKYPNKNVELYGFDVFEHGAKKNDYLNGVIGKLSSFGPSVPWGERITTISNSERWPYEDDYFDLILSNQVLEHVHDHDFLFSEVARTLKPGGFSAHLFPLSSCFVEGHILVPLAHRIKNYELLKSFIRFFIRVKAIRHFPDLLEKNMSLTRLSESYADYLVNYTNYPSTAKCLRLGRKYKMRTSFKYTKNFYLQKLRSMVGLNPRRTYDKNNTFADYGLFMFLKYVSCVTLFMQKENIK
ncbi:class I SAM-dependent methyltransferase [uncultured Desulfuromonas sp.]|uniref:class I SAM-dependent methyltransferase n=1 Tax=uncultured Desulfuromonas sp. TaxID=181013 RepID=UPI00260AB2C2|nr:class I SAM-dependent methyltransferase [uncultured Desulfuromonas sp.]